MHFFRGGSLLTPILLVLTLVSVHVPAAAQKKPEPKKTPAGKFQPAKQSPKASEPKTAAKTAAQKAPAKTPAKGDSRQTSTNNQPKAKTSAKPDAKTASKAADKKAPATASKNSRTAKTKETTPSKKLSAKEKRRLEAERRRAEAEERRRREQLAREAAERRRQFELGLRNQTIENILKDNLEGEDMEVRRAVTEALRGHAGTVVVLEPKTGRILSIVNQDWAVRQGFKPCSTIKLVTGIAGLNERKIAPDGAIAERGFPMNLDDALAHSNNPYFQVVGQQMGNQMMISYAKALGLGQPTGINLPGESAGKLPWNNGNPRIYSHGDDFEVTPLQLAVMVSAITNGGRVVVPRIVPKFERANFRPASRRETGLPMDSVQGVIPGMLGAAIYGTARRNLDQSLGVAGKTGSCIGQGTWVGLFASVAPVEDPKLAVVVVTRGESQRGRHAAAIAANIYSSLRGRIGVRRGGIEPLIAANPKLRPQNKVSATQAAKLDADSDEDADETRTPRSNPNIRATGQSSPTRGGATRPRVVMDN